MNRRMMGLALGTVVAGVACAAKSPPVPIRGSVATLEALVGRWEGEYVSAETGRNGTITFELTAGADSAFGDVIMVPRGYNRPLRPYRDELPGEVRQGTDWPELLTIEFVAAQGNRVLGRLSPYRDPECGCPLATTFEGVIEGDTIEGTFTSRHLAHDLEQTGTWNVRRRSTR